MKYIKSYGLVAVISVSMFSSGFLEAGQIAPVKRIDVIVKKDPGNSSGRQIATLNKDGNYTVQLPAAGRYTITYANGPKKGQVIKIVTVGKAGSVIVCSASGNAGDSIF